MCQYAKEERGREVEVDCGLPAINSAVFGFLTAKKLASFSSALWPRNSCTAGDGNPKVLAAVKSGAFKLKLQAKQTAAGRDCQLGLGNGEWRLDWDCWTNEKRAKWQCENCA